MTWSSLILWLLLQNEASECTGPPAKWRRSILILSERCCHNTACWCWFYSCFLRSYFSNGQCKTVVLINVEKWLWTLCWNRMQAFSAGWTQWLVHYSRLTICVWCKVSTPQIDGFLNIKITTVVDIQVSTGFKIQVCYILFYWIFSLDVKTTQKE